jgi:hypothetical protein
MTVNLVPGRDRAVSVVALDEPPDRAALGQHLPGRQAYRRSRYVVAHCGDAVAVAALTLADTEPLMSAITDVEVLAEPGEAVWLEAPEVDTGVPGQLAALAGSRAPGARCVVARGRYGHVNFILEPQPVAVRVVDIVPPEPPKLIDQARRLLAVADDLPPIALDTELIDLRADAAAHPRPRYLLPCRGGGGLAGHAEVAYLDQRPARRAWTLLGCQRSCELHHWLYADLPEVIDMCPRQRQAQAPGLTLTKCCLIEQGVELDEGASTAVVPWGASLAEVRAAIDELVAITEPAWVPA